MKLRVRWKKPVKLAITLDPEDRDGAQDMRVILVKTTSG